MLIDHDGFNRGPEDPGGWDALPGDEALLMWSMRRMVVAWPRCHAVQAALHARYGDEALGVEHLLRCWLTGVSRHARRRLVIGDPNCAMLLPDEASLLFVLRRATPPVAAAAMIEALTGNPCAACLLPLASSLAAVARL
ncbi:MAG: hypothetical protein ACRYG4_02615 [Janthinobacterium lividum]